jgi:hypothetical protein
MDELPADRAARLAGRIEAAWPIATRCACADALAGATLDPAKLLDVDVDELAGSSPLVADRMLEPEPAEPADSVALEHDRDGRERH